MFTGLVYECAEVLPSSVLPKTLELKTSNPRFLDCAIGASISVNGVCLTLVRKTTSGVLTFEVGEETLRVTNFKRLREGDHVHLEPSLKVGDELGGHWVLGHVDAVATLVRRVEGGSAKSMELGLTFRVEGPLAKEVASHLVYKGSIAVNGVSLTLNEIRDEPNQHAVEFSVWLIPHTLKITHFLNLSLGESVHIETDTLSKFSKRTLEVNKIYE